MKFIDVVFYLEPKKKNISHDKLKIIILTKQILFLVYPYEWVVIHYLMLYFINIDIGTTKNYISKTKW